MGILTESLKNAGIDSDRIKVEEVPPKDAGKFTAATKSFMEQIRSLGPLMTERAR
jgi:coenzyme F420-reducing hydrogenase delta subunit